MTSVIDLREVGMKIHKSKSINFEVTLLDISCLLFDSFRLAKRLVCFAY